MVSPSFLHIDDGIFTNIASVLFPNAPNQISNNANVSSNPLGEPRNTLLDTRMQRQIDEHVAPTVDSERRLPDMLLELHDRTGEVNQVVMGVKEAVGEAVKTAVVGKRWRRKIRWGKQQKGRK